MLFRQHLGYAVAEAADDGVLFCGNDAFVSLAAFCDGLFVNGA